MELEATLETKQNPWKTVTPLSKFLAMVLFVTLPFIGGWVGYTFVPGKVVEVEKIIEVEKMIVAKDNIKDGTMNTVSSTTSQVRPDVTKTGGILSIQYSYPQDWEETCGDTDSRSSCFLFQKDVENKKRISHLSVTWPKFACKNNSECIEEFFTTIPEDYLNNGQEGDEIYDEYKRRYDNDEHYKYVESFINEKVSTNAILYAVDDDRGIEINPSAKYRTVVKIGKNVVLIDVYSPEGVMFLKEFISSLKMI